MCVGECLLRRVRSTHTWMDAGDGSTPGRVAVCAGHTHTEPGAAHTQQPMLSCALPPLRLNQPIILFIRLLHAGKSCAEGEGGVSLPLS